MVTTRQALAAPGNLRIEGPPRDTLADRAYQSIRVAIVNHDLEPDRYYSEAWLAGEMGISRTPTHAALLQLEIEGMVEIVAQRGFRLRQVTDEEYDEFYDVRIILETNVLHRLCQRVDAEALGRLRDVLDRQRRVVDDPLLFQDLDEGFHRAMAEAAGLRRTAAIIHSLRGILWLGTAHRPVAEREAVVAEHAAIVDGVAARDPDAAVAALEAHLRRSQQRRYRSVLGVEPAPAPA